VTERSEVAALGAIVSALAIVALAQQGPPGRDDAEPAPRVASTRAPAPASALIALRDGQTLDLNCVDAAALELLPGVGPALAQRIVEHRAQAGRFASVDALDAVRGVGPKTLAAVRPLLSVGASCPASTTPKR
jgi:competence protein ComEA